MVEKIFKKIRMKMQEKKMSVEELAQKSGLTIKCIKSIKDGTRKSLTLDELYNISIAFEINIKELL